MRDCANVRIRELLPDLLHGGLAVAVRVEVQAHVDDCAACQAELLILRQVLAVTSTPRVDVSRIAARLPSYRATPAWRRMASSPQWRVAAAVVLIAGAAAVGTTVTHSGRDGRDVSVPPPSGVAELAVGEPLLDLSDTDLRSLRDELTEFDAMTPAETEVVPPSLERSGGGS